MELKNFNVFVNKMVAKYGINVTLAQVKNEVVGDTK